MAGADSVTVATDSAEVAADPPEVMRRTVRLVATRMRRHEIVVAALKETALRSTVRLPTGPPVQYQSCDSFILILPLLCAKAGALRVDRTLRPRARARIKSAPNSVAEADGNFHVIRAGENGPHSFFTPIAA